MTGELSPARRAYIASSVRNAVDVAFAHWEAARDVDVETLYQRLLEETIARGDRNHFSLEMAAFLASLRNGHTLYFDHAVWKPLGGSLGFRAAPIGKTWTITKAWRPGLRAGEVLERLDGMTPTALYDQHRPYLSASSESSRQRRWTARPHLFPRNLTLQVEGRRMAVRRTPGRNDPPTESTTGRWLRRGKVGYVRVPSFSDPRHEKCALEQVHRFREARAIVFDVRGNTGGTSPNGLVRALMDRPWRWWAESTPQRVGWVRARVHLHDMVVRNQGRGLFLSPERPALLELLSNLDRAQVLFPPSIERGAKGAYRGRLVALVDGYCGSACEDFLMPLKDTGRATIVGATTDGSTGQPYILDFKEGIRAFVGSKRAYFPDGRTFEGVGIAPDREVIPSREDLLAGRDPVLDAAVDLVP